MPDSEEERSDAEKEHWNQFQANQSLREDFGFLENAMMSVPTGWVPIVRKLCEDVEEIDVGIDVHQIKEKFGSIRFYYTTLSSREDINELIKDAQSQAKRTCQRCGEPGEDRSVNNWITVLCNDCYKDSTANE